jgi:hypothetical protein
MTERQLQKLVVDYLRLALPPDVFWSALPLGSLGNTGGGGKARGGMMKGLGVKAGLPDLMLVYDGRAFFIELKIDGGRTSAVQDDAQSALRAAGAQVRVCRCLEAVEDVLALWGVPAREIAI